MRKADKVGTLPPDKPGYDRVQIGVRRQAGTSAEMPQEPGQYPLPPGCARLMLLHERAYSDHPQPQGLHVSGRERYLFVKLVAERG
jgi:hypothetical protein